MQDRGAEFHNVDYQQQLAAALVSNQGLEGAIRSCQEFGWEGVLERLMARVHGQAPRPAAG